ncbi:MAG: YfjI family protein [Chloroflexota bacterium]
MLGDTTNPSAIFARALQGLPPTPDQLASLDPAWQDAVQAAATASPKLRHAALVFIRAGVDNVEALVKILRLPDPSPEQPWPEPIPFERPTLPRFPDHVLPDWLGNYVRSEARATQTPTDLPAILALAVLSTALAGRVTLNPWADWIEPLNLYTLVALPPGHRKSAVFSSVTAPLHHYEAEAARTAAPILALARRRQHAAEQALLRAQDAAASVSDDDPRQPQLLANVERCLEQLATSEIPVAPRLITDDCSPERLAMLLHQHGGKLAILSPEGGIFDLIAGRYSSTGAPNLDHFLKGHAGDPIVVDRVGRAGEIIPRPALTIGLAVQPEVLRGLAARPGFHGRGLLARFLYALPNATLGHRTIDLDPVDPGLRAMYHRHILTLLTHPFSDGPTPDPLQTTAHPDRPLLSSPTDGDAARSLPLSHHPVIVLTFDLFAEGRLKTFAESVEPRLAPDGDLSPIVDWASKLVGATARIAGLLHLAALAPTLPACLSPDSPLPLSPSHSPAAPPRLPLSALVGAQFIAPAGGGGYPAVSLAAVESATTIAHYLVEHAKAAYAAMGLDPAVADVPALLAWLQRAGRPTFTRRDALRATGRHLRSPLDLDDALDQLERHNYIRPARQPRRVGQGRPAGPTYDVHPSLLRAPTSLPASSPRVGAQFIAPTRG